MVTQSLKLILVFLTSYSLAIQSHAQNFCDAESEGSADDIEFGIDIDADGGGNFFVCGGYRPNCEFGGQNYPGNGGLDLFLAKYNAGGNLVWNQHLGGSGSDKGVKVFAGEDAHVYVAGSVKLAPEPGGQNEWMHQYDAFFAKYDTSGSLVWMKELNGNNYSDGLYITATPSGIAYCAGIFNTLSYNDTDTLVSYGNDDIMLIKYTPLGTELWALNVGSRKKDTHPCVGVDAAGYIYLAGQFEDTLLIGTDSLFATAGKEIFILKLDNSGNLVWGRTIEGSLNEIPSAISVNPDGSFYLSGNFTGDINLSSLHSSTGSNDGFLARFDSSGMVLWEKFAGGPSYNEVVDVDTDPYGNVYYGGYSYDTLYLDSLVLLNGGGGLEDMFFASYGETGDLRFAKQPPLNLAQYCFGIAAGVGEILYLTGSYIDSMVLGSNTLLSVSSTEDIFWARYADSTYLRLDSISGPPACVNDAFNIWFTARGCFDFSNVFTAQLSDSSGSFASPTDLGTLAAMSGGSILCNIPGGITGGGGYRVRLLSDSPAFTSNDNGFDIAISTTASNPPQIIGDSVICPGDTIVLDAGAGYSTYLWNTTATSQTISVTTAGTYTVDVTDSMGCSGFASHSISICIRRDDPFDLTQDLLIFPNPASELVTFSGNFPGARIEIYSAEGKFMRQLQMNEESGLNLDLGEFGSGMYLILLHSGDNTGHYRLFICK